MQDVLHCTESENRMKRGCSEVDTLITNAAATDIPEFRLDLYRQIERLFFAEDGLEPIAPLYTRSNLILSQSWVHFVPSPFGGEHYDTYTIDLEIRELERSR
jgi:hypothetical protein